MTFKKSSSSASGSSWQGVSRASSEPDDAGMAALALSDEENSDAGSEDEFAGLTEAELEALIAQEEAALPADTLEAGESLEDLDSRRRQDRQASKAAALAASRRRIANLAVGTSAAREQAGALRTNLNFRQTGVDICIMMDITGSMGRCIEAVKTKAVEILELAPRLHSGAITRLSFVGYRDFPPESSNDCPHFTVVDFVEKNNFRDLEMVIMGMRAGGGGDAEDVTGALKKVLQLNWRSSTRLVIHFGDAPCHGDEYHDGHPVNGPDAYPDGNPDGLVPEELLQDFCRNRIDYHFARLGSHTDIMTRIFSAASGVFKGANGAATFEMHDYNQAAEEFIPVVLKSLTSSMRRSFRSGSSSSSAGATPLPEAFQDLAGS
ncbi:hypothetical protein ABPG75_002709 [Micractinium tetrahymenae]